MEYWFTFGPYDDDYVEPPTPEDDDGEENVAPEDSDPEDEQPTTTRGKKQALKIAASNF